MTWGRIVVSSKYLNFLLSLIDLRINIFSVEFCGGCKTFYTSAKQPIAHLATHGVEHERQSSAQIFKLKKKASSSLMLLDLLDFSV